jgi:hypothetical protein
MPDSFRHLAELLQDWLAGKQAPKRQHFSPTVTLNLFQGLVQVLPDAETNSA